MHFHVRTQAFVEQVDVLDVAVGAFSLLIRSVATIVLGNDRERETRRFADTILARSVSNRTAMLERANDHIRRLPRFAALELLREIAEGADSGDALADTLGNPEMLKGAAVRFPDVARAFESEAAAWHAAADEIRAIVKVARDDLSTAAASDPVIASLIQAPIDDEPPDDEEDGSESAPVMSSDQLRRELGL